LLGSCPAAVATNDVHIDFSSDGENLGSLSLTNNGAHSSGGFAGVEVGGIFTGDYPPLSPNVEARWVQLVNTSHPFSTTNTPFTPHFDPGEQDGTGDFDPFYWNTTLTAKDGTNYGGFFYKFYQTPDGHGISFYDKPSRAISDAPVSWEAELNLVLWETGSTAFEVLWTGSYGFEIDTGGLVSASGITDGSLGFLTQERLSLAFPGWSVIPEPSTLLLGVFSVLLAVGWRRLNRQ
jgi:hypothetical protein